jgi:hypothetical protein
MGRPFADMEEGVTPASSLGPLFAMPIHPVYNAFDWETWPELEVLHRELALRFGAKKP